MPVRAQITSTAGTLGAATGTSEATAAPPAGTAANDVAIVYCWARNSGDTTTVSGYTEIPSTHVSTSTGSHRWFWLRLSGAASTATCDHNTSSDSYARMFVFRGLVTSGNPWDAVNAGVSRHPDSNGEYTASGLTAGAQSMVVVFSGYEDNDEANIACTGTAPATYTASYAESSTGSGGSINACSAIKSSAGATGDILVHYGNVAGSHDAGTLVISLAHACSGPTIGAHTVCGAATSDIPSPAAFVSATYTPAVGNGVLLILTWGGGTDSLDESITSIVNQDGTSLGCFVPSPGSTFKLYSGPGTDAEAWAFYYCPAIPSSPSISAIRTNLSASTAYLQEIVVEFSAGTIQTTDFWDTDNTAVSFADELEASVSVTNSHANDLLIAYLHNGLPVYPNGGYPPVTADSNYTAIVANPAYNTNEMLEAKAVSSTGSQTATITWSNTPTQWFAGIVGLKAVDSGTTPTFTFDLSTLPAQTFGNAAFSVASYVTTNSTGTATFALGAGSVGCTVTSAGLVTITGAAIGTNFCVISASLAAIGNYLGAGPISQSFQIAQATPTFTFDLSTLPPQTLGNAPFSIATYSTTNSTGAITFALGTGSFGCSVTSAGLVTITGAAIGTNFCVISASLAANGNYLGVGPISQSFHIAQTTATLQSISVTPVNQALLTGTSLQFVATGTYSDGSMQVITSSATWSSSNAAVASISSTGSAIGLSTGTSTIEATFGGVSGFTTLSVSQTVFTTQTPAETNDSDGPTSNYELGTRFQSTAAGQITAIRFWKASKETGTHTGHIWSNSGMPLATVVFTGETASGWQQQALASPITIAAATAYVVSVNTGSTYYVATTNGLATQIVNGDLKTVVGTNGVYGSAGGYPTNTYEATNYFRDIVFVQVAGPTITATQGTAQSATIGQPFPTSLQATVKDSSSNPLANVLVTFSAPVTGAGGTFGASATVATDSNGVATAPTFTANTTAGSYTVTASAVGAATPASFALTNLAGSPASITATAGSSQTAVIGKPFATALQATVNDASNNPVANVAVTFAAPTGGASGTFASSASVNTNSSGVATAPTFTANTTTGSYVVMASVNGVGTDASFNLTNISPPPASITASFGTPQSATIGMAFATSLQATVKDASSNPLSGVTVTFAAPTSGASGTFGGSTSVTTDVNGIATAPTFTANTTAGIYKVTASVSGVTTAANFNLTNNPGLSASITATLGTPQTATIGTAFATALQATVKDASNNPVANVAVMFAAPTSGASGTFGSSATVNTNASGVAIAPTFTANSTPGSYMVTASVSGATTQAGFDLTNTSAPPIAIDVNKSTDRGAAAKTIASPSFSTASTNELLLAFVASDSSGRSSVSVSGITTTGLTWTPVERTNNQLGTAEIWRAFASAKLSSVTATATLTESVAASITVMSFTGVNSTGTNGAGAIGAAGTGNADPGAPTASLTTTQANSLVIGVGNDWDNAISRTVGPNQVIVHQYLSPTGDTYWVQRVTTLSPAGTKVTVNDTAPAGDRYNLSICEIVP